jgi:hypothetical protein
MEVIFNTNGKGYWSRTAKGVWITDIQLGKATMWEGDTDKDMFGELRVYFNTASWDVDQHGLIYTDKGFIKELQSFLNLHSLPGNDVSYSEQGMQGDDYVSLDAGHKFYKAWMEKFSIPREQMVEVF